MNDPMKLEEEFREKFCDKDYEILLCFAANTKDILAWFKTKLDEKDKKISLWKYCPECGCVGFVENKMGDKEERTCTQCGQDWFVDVDYSDVVIKKLKEITSLRGEIDELTRLLDEKECWKEAKLNAKTAVKKSLEATDLRSIIREMGEGLKDSSNMLIDAGFAFIPKKNHTTPLPSRHTRGDEMSDDGITMTIKYTEGKENCQHNWKESLLLGVRVCQSPECKRIEPLK